MPNIPRKTGSSAYKAIPDPVVGDDSLYHAVVALKEVVEVLTRQRKPLLSSAVTFQDLVDYGLIGTDGRALQDYGTLMHELANPTVGPSVLLAVNDLSDVASAPTSRSNLGLGSIATHPTTDFLSSTVPCFSAHKNGTNQGVFPYGVATQITFTTEVYDVGSYFASSAWTPPAGKVFMTAASYSVPDGGGGPTGCAIYIVKNGAVIKQAVGTNLFGVNCASITVEDVANGTDVYTVSKYDTQTIGGGTSTVIGGPEATYFMGHWISP